LLVVLVFCVVVVGVGVVGLCVDVCVFVVGDVMVDVDDVVVVADVGVVGVGGAYGADVGDIDVGVVVAGVGDVVAVRGDCDGVCCGVIDDVAVGGVGVVVIFVY